MRRRYHLNGQADARQLATGSDFGERPGGLARVGADQELHMVQALGGRRFAWGDVHVETCFAHGQEGQLLLHLFAQANSGLLACFGELFGFAAVTLAVLGHLTAEGF